MQRITIFCFYFFFVTTKDDLKGKHYFTTTTTDVDIIVFLTITLPNNLNLLGADTTTKQKSWYTRLFLLQFAEKIKTIEEKSFQSIELEKYVTTNNCPTRQGRFYYFIHLSVMWTLWVIFYTFFYDEIDGHWYQKVWIVSYCKRFCVSTCVNNRVSWHKNCLEK